MDLIAGLALVGLLFVKEAGLPVPVPGDLLVIGAGVAAGGDPSVAAVSLAAILAAGYAGGSLQFVLARGALRPVLERTLARIGIPPSQLDRLADRLRRHGARGVAVARATPLVRVGAITASGLAALPFAAFFAGLVVGNAIFVGGHFLFGFAIGPAALDLVAAGANATFALGALAVFAAFGAVGWSILRRGRRRSRPEWTLEDASQPGAYGAWADTACPACLAIGVARSRRGGGGLR